MGSKRDMFKIIIFLIFLFLLGCNRNQNKVESKKEIKYFNLDSNIDITPEEAENSYFFKLFPNGDTNFIYFFKDNLANDYVAWDTNGQKTLENNIGVLREYDNSILESEYYFNGEIGTYKMFSYFKSGSIRAYFEWKNFKPKLILEYNENGDTINYEVPNN